jgi:hypothetical protein
MKKWSLSLFISVLIIYAAGFTADAVSKPMQPSTVVDITKENTYPNPAQDLPHLEPSKFTKELLRSANVIDSSS